MSAVPIQDLEPRIVQSALAEDPRVDKPKCPYCGEEDVHVKGHGMTLTERDNHITEQCLCGACRTPFTREEKSGNVWYTEFRRQGPRVLKGLPSCFERYTLTCRTCEGEVVRQFRSEEPPSRKYEVFFLCRECPWEVQTDRGHWPLKREGEWR